MRSNDRGVEGLWWLLQVVVGIPAATATSLATFAASVATSAATFSFSFKIAPEATSGGVPGAIAASATTTHVCRPQKIFIFAFYAIQLTGHQLKLLGLCLGFNGHVPLKSQTRLFLPTSISQ